MLPRYYLWFVDALFIINSNADGYLYNNNSNMLTEAAMGTQVNAQTKDSSYAKAVYKYSFY